MNFKTPYEGTLD